MTAPTKQRNFFLSLFDFGFTSLIAIRFAKFIYVVGVVLISIDALFDLIFISRLGKGWIVGGIIVAAISWLVQMVGWRILIEFMIVFFRMGSDVHKIAVTTGAEQAQVPVLSQSHLQSPQAAPVTAPLAPPAAGPPSVTYCGSCGSALAAGTRVCPTCGTPANG